MTKLVERNDLHTLNKKAVTNSFQSNTTHDYTNLPIKKFKNYVVNELKEFIHIYVFEMGSISSGQESRIPKNKGNLEEARGS